MGLFSIKVWVFWWLRPMRHGSQLHQLFHFRSERWFIHSAHAIDVSLSMFVVHIFCLSPSPTSFFLHHRLPYNWKTPLGFLFTGLVVTATYFAIFLCILPTVLFFAGSCQYIIIFVQDIANDLENLSVENIQNRSETDQVDRRVTFCKIIKLHSEVKQLSMNRAQVLKHTLTHLRFSIQVRWQIQWDLWIHHVHLLLVCSFDDLLPVTAFTLTTS